jgi:bifunctional non-homologous end joining protein LigD
MQPIEVDNLTQDNQFIYEVKYDGFRAMLIWEEHQILLVSRNGIDLTHNFPEIIAVCRANTANIKDLLPLQLDGELVILNLPYQADFASIQKRGRLKNATKIEAAANKRPVYFIFFDLLQYIGEDYRHHILLNRKQQLQLIAQKIRTNLLKPIDTFDSYHACAAMVFESKGEGIVAKRKNSRYLEGKNNTDWQKEKNWRTIIAIVTTYDPRNGYFGVVVYEAESIQSIGKCKHGLTEEARKALQHLFVTKGDKRGGTYILPPAICCKIHTLDLFQGELREPSFVALIPEMDVTTCTKNRLQQDLAMFPLVVNITNTEKLFWSDERLTKADLLTYIRPMFPYMKPYLYNRALTIIRCPDGVDDTCFFQKHLPDYAPEVFRFTDDRYIICNSVEAMVWLANHSAVEYHLPYQPVDDNRPHEIVFDLDPPTRNQFSLAIDVALLIKQILDELDLIAFIKTSGNKGLQIHVPLPTGKFTYEETGSFTKRIADIVVKTAPNLCTTERFKKNRGNKLYLDYVQHGKGKTIIAPYSPRKTKEATVAAPLFWEEVKHGLMPEHFTIRNMLSRVQAQGCPWIFKYEAAAREQTCHKALPLFNLK